MLINAVSFEPEETGMSPEELKAVRELCANELMQKFFRSQNRAILLWAVREIDPFKAEMDDAKFRQGMQKIHAIASVWLQIAEATEQE